MKFLSAVTLNGDHMFNIKVQTTKGIDNVKYSKKDIILSVSYCIPMLKILLS